MPGYLIEQGATVLCAHGGQATAMVPNPSVTVEGVPTCLLPDAWLVAACPGVPSLVPPCVTAEWAVGATRVTSFGQPLLVQSGQAITAPGGTPLLPVVTQIRVTAI